MGINIDSLQRGISREALLEQIQRNYEANFDKQKAEETIADLEDDVSRLALKRNQAHDVLKAHKAEYEVMAAKYKQTYDAWKTLND